MSAPEPRLAVQGMRAGYERDVAVLKDVSIEAWDGRVAGIIGANGAGKSTLLKSVLGYLKPRQGRVVFSGRDITGRRPDLSCGRGIGYLMEGHSIFPAMTVEENLLLGLWPLRRDRARVAAALEKAYDRAPMLRERRRTSAGLLSGGQQRILEIERIGMTEPSLIMLDEPSLGLAPKLTEEMFARVVRFREDGISVILVDQNIRRVAQIADHIYVLQLGEMKLEGSGAEVAADIENIVKEFI